ncbi:MAG: permease [Clostridia bacterium]|nr:permease [Clostridia bacterium]
MLSIMLIAALGYGLGRVSIKGISLGTAGVFVIALLFGALFPTFLTNSLTTTVDGRTISFASNALKIVENLGLVLFVSSVGFIAGPNFFANFKKNFKSYILLGSLIIVVGGLSAVGCIYFGRWLESGNPHFDPKELTAMIVGLFSGSLTSTPAFSTAKETVAPIYEAAVTVGYGIAYLFGVVGVVLFIQLVPRVAKVDMEEERKHLIHEDEKKKEESKKLIEIDEFGIAPFALTVVLGLLLGAIKIAKFFSLGTTGGTLIVSLIVGYVGRIGPISLMPRGATLKVFRELGLMLFLIGAGVAGGIRFIEYFNIMYFVYGVIMTVMPMLVGFVFARYVLKLSLLNSLGSITGGMTSTPALGTLIHMAKTEDVAAAYAATYPIALIAVVLVSEFLIILF